jgi:hypothetical protein
MACLEGFDKDLINCKTNINHHLELFQKSLAESKTAHFLPTAENPEQVRIKQFQIEKHHHYRQQ